MQTKTKNKMVTWLILLAMVMATCSPFAMKAEAVEHSKTSYSVYLKGADVFLRNAKTIGSELGTEYFLKYTVKDVGYLPQQQGLCGTSEPDIHYPYQKGFMRYSNNAAEDEAVNLLTEGATYYIKYTIAEECFTYDVVREKDGKLEKLYLTMPEGVGEDMTHFGLWFSLGKVRAELTNVLCYDAEGNDLGVTLPVDQGLVIPTSNYLKKDTAIDHRYEVIVSNKTNISISHVEKATTSKVYLEYKVKSAEYTFTQEGIAISKDGLGGYPHSTGVLQYNGYDPASDSVKLLEVGAEYIICMEKGETNFTAYVQKTKDGKTTVFSFDTEYAVNADAQADTFCLWFGESVPGSFHLEDVKFYDANKNNLKVQCNQDATIFHHGSLEDYAGCEATYYCEETGDSFALYENQKLKFTTGDALSEGTYHISDNVMTLKMNGEEYTYEYLYARITDEEQNVYNRLYNYKVEFVTGSEDVIETQELSNKTGYLAERPQDPSYKDYDFEGWYLEDGTEFDFEKLVTESSILYAKYSGDGRTFLAGQEDIGNGLKVWWMIGGTVLFLGAVTTGICVMRKVGKDGNKKETD